VRPDLAGWRRERLPSPGNVRPVAVVPDWVCEITSPSTASLDRVTKRALYALHGVKHYWSVDPAARTLEALELQGERWVELGAWDESAVERIPPFDALELELARLFLPREADPAPEP
jgi:Uma2 family endonuclease